MPSPCQLRTSLLGRAHLLLLKLINLLISYALLHLAFGFTSKFCVFWMHIHNSSFCYIYKLDVLLFFTSIQSDHSSIHFEPSDSSISRWTHLLLPQASILQSHSSCHVIFQFALSDSRFKFKHLNWCLTLKFCAEQQVHLPLLHTATVLLVKSAELPWYFPFLSRIKLFLLWFTFNFWCSLFPSQVCTSPLPGTDFFFLAPPLFRY